MNLFKIFLLIQVCIFIFSCNSDMNDQLDLNSVLCESKIIISVDKFNSATTEELTIHSVIEKNGCLQVTYASGGCNGDSFHLELYDSGEVITSKIDKRLLKFNFIDKEDCEAYIKKETSFELPESYKNKPLILSIEGVGEIRINEF